jgi:hypothetical protein
MRDVLAAQLIIVLLAVLGGLASGAEAKLANRSRPKSKP